MKNSPSSTSAKSTWLPLVIVGVLLIVVGVALLVTRGGDAAASDGGDPAAAETDESVLTEDVDGVEAGCRVWTPQRLRQQVEHRFDGGCRCEHLAKIAHPLNRLHEPFGFVTPAASAWV